MKEIPLPEKISYPLAVAASGPAGCYSVQLELLEKVNEIVRFLNARRTLADMSPEEIEKIGKFIQELDKREWKIPPYNPDLSDKL